MPLGYHLPPDYYRAVPTSITACTVLLVWITLPVLSYNPDLMDPILSDYYEAWADWAKSNVLKMFNFMLWVSFYHCNFYENVARFTYITWNGGDPCSNFFSDASDTMYHCHPKMSCVGNQLRNNNALDFQCRDKWILRSSIFSMAWSISCYCQNSLK